ncbi:MAG: nickel/cobalt efflux transporter [Pseudomonadota bacterium]
MSQFSTLLQQGNAWLFVPSAVLLGALHGLEPGHSKTMMAAFIIAIRGSLAQAVLLGLSATLSHTAVVWLIAMAGLYFGSRWDMAASEPYFQMASAVLILGVAVWMMWRTWRHRHLAQHGHSHRAHEPAKGGDALELSHSGAQDPHALAHANEIKQRFSNRAVTTSQIVWFGLSSGLIPCPASITVLLLCLQLKKIALGAVLVLCFSLGLGITMVASGVFAALSMKHLAKRFKRFGNGRGLHGLTHKAPYFSGALISFLGLYFAYQAWHGLH